MYHVIETQPYYEETTPTTHIEGNSHFFVLYIIMTNWLENCHPCLNYLILFSKVYKIVNLGFSG